MLRLKEAVSAVEDFTAGTFREVIPDEAADPAAVTRVLMCAGKVYYDLAAEREKRGDASVAIVRLEQFYPLAEDEVRRALAPFPHAEVVWVQEEPRNQGAWAFVSLTLPGVIGRSITVVSRPASASPASGFTSRHAAEQEAVVAQAYSRS
jgi:2-oxoglutarate decarboxylase